MSRYALCLEYDGGDFSGWQSQSNGPSVQASVEAALSRVADQKVRVHGSGRTDAGVHATGQVAHFDSEVQRTVRQWLLGLNANLADSIVARWLVPVSGEFDARRSAAWREYAYTIVNRPVRPALGRGAVAWVREPLDVGAMLAAASAWLGEHDFSALRAAHCQSRTAVRCLLRVAVDRVDAAELRLVFRANAFLYHMVRNMVGTLIEVGTGRMTVSAAAALLATGDRTLAGPTAPAPGLCLRAIGYPDRFALPPMNGPDG